MSVVDHQGDAGGPAALIEAELAAAQAARESSDPIAALAAYEAALSADPHCMAALTGIGVVLRALGRPRDALAPLIRAIDLQPRDLTARLELALVLAALDRTHEARALFALLVREADSPAQAWVGLAQMALGEGHDIAAETALRRAVAQAPDLTSARLQLADLLIRRQDLAGAVDLYHDILAMEPVNVAALTGLGQSLIGLGRPDEAADQLERALALNPDDGLAHLARARLNLIQGNPLGAWDDLEWRWQVAGRQRPEPPGQAWDGNNDVNASTILVWAEQGISEVIFQLRFVPALAARGATVVLGVPRPLTELARTVPGVAHVVASGQPLPPGLHLDFQVALGDLPRLFAIGRDGIPAAPFLTAPAARRPRVTAPQAAVMKIGLCWSGPRASWNIPFPDLMPVLSRPDAAFFSLQLGARAQDAARLAHPALITDLSPTIADHADLAGRIAEMDLVVTVDSAVAHLAGAMAKPVWVMLAAAADWMWGQDRDDTPWYPGARLFRQRHPGDWTTTVGEIDAALSHALAQEHQRRRQVAHGQDGPGATERAFLSTLLADDDAFVDIGCDGGGHVLDAVGTGLDIRVLAVESRVEDADILRDTLAVAGIDEECVQVVAAILAGRPGPVVVPRRPRAGAAILTLPAWVASPAQGQTVEQLIASRPELSGRRLVMRLGRHTDNAAIVAGLGQMRPAAVVFDHRPGDTATAQLGELGYGLYQFPADVTAGAVGAFTGRPAAVLALAPGLVPAPLYGDVTDPTSPASMARAVTQAAQLAAQGVAALATGQVNAAGEAFGRALALDPGNIDANANLGGLLRRIGRADAALACWRRALAAGAGPMVRANMANTLRETGRLAQAEAAFLEVMTDRPEHADVLYAFALLQRDRGRSRDAVGLMERAESLKPGTVPRAELAAALLKSGNLARGMAEMAHRRRPPQLVVDAPSWGGDRLEGRTILIRDEGDTADTVMLSRYIPMVALQGGLVVLECVPAAARLLSTLAGVEQVVPRGEALPPVETQVQLADVPRLLGTTSRTTPPRTVPYFRLPEVIIPFRFPDDRRLHVGLSWVGERPRDRAIPVSQMMRLAVHPGIDLISLQRGERVADLVASGNRLFVEDMGSRCADLADLAGIIAGLDLVVTTDTVEAHVAGAMGKPVWVLLPQGNDWRWVDGRDDSVWYPTMRVFRQDADGGWDRAIARIGEAMAAMAAGKRARLRQG